MTARGFFVTGTDTEVGKTCVAAAILHCLGRDGAVVAGCKPVAAGTTAVDGIPVNEDVRLLRDSSTLTLTYAEVGPCQLKEPCAPHVAAELDGVVIDRAALCSAVKTLASRADWLVVEGVGGFRVPMGNGWDSADLALDLGLPVILVVGLRLGCLNHALLTAEAIEHRGLRLAGWIANGIDPAMPRVDASIEALRSRLPAPCLGVVPRLAHPAPTELAAHLVNAGTLRALARTIKLSGVPA